MKKAFLFITCYLISVSAWAKTESDDLRLKIETSFLEQWADRLHVSSKPDLPESSKKILLGLRAQASISTNEQDLSEYLRQSGIHYLESGDLGQKAFEILGLEKGPWLNRIAWDLLMESKTALFLRPALLIEGNYGVYRFEKKRIELILPPWRGASTEFLSHESYHASIMTAVKQEVPHLLAGYIQNPKGLETSYPEMDLSELGAYVETLISLSETLDGGYPPQDVAKLLKSYFLTLNKMASAVVFRFDELLDGPLDRLAVIRLEEKKGVDFVGDNATGLKTVLRNFGFEVPRGYTAEWNLATAPAFREGAIDRLQFQRGLFERFRRRVEDLRALLNQQQLALFRVRARQLREFLWDLNREWLLHLQITRGTHPYLLDSKTAHLIRGQRECQALLSRI